MANSIEILQNTLLKLVIRSGSDSDRLSTTLDVGELGYTTDSERVYVGDGITPGGSLVGNKVAQSAVNFSAFTASTVVEGDIAFHINEQALYRFSGGDPTDLNDWSQIGGIYSAGDTTITVASGAIAVGSLSAGNISQNALGQSLIIDTGQITLSSQIAVNSIIPQTGTSLTIPSEITVNGLDYTFPSAALVTDTFLRTDSSGNLSWSNINTLLSAASGNMVMGAGLSAYVDGVPQTSTFSLLTSGEITLGGVFLPTAHITFGQNPASITRQRRVDSVSDYTYAAAAVEIGTINGKSLSASAASTDAAYSGAYLITTTDSFDTATVVVDVQIHNASYYNTGAVLYSPTLSYRYKILSATQILVVFYVPTTIIQGTGYSISTTYPGTNFMTPGFADPNTKFSVTVYG